MENPVTAPWVRAKRITQTNLVLQKNALRWLVGKRTPSPQLLRQLFEDLGTTYVKIGQLIASMPSVFPPQYVEAFQGCLDNTKPLRFAKIERVLKKELRDPGRHFAWIDEQPLASASIAQVHAARLHSGEEVVIKVQRPNARDIVSADLSMLKRISRVLELLAPRLKHLSLADMVEEIRSGMLEECDFEREAENIASYDKFITALGTDTVRVPRLYPEASTKRVLTMERFYGVPLTDPEVVRQYHPDPETVLVETLNVWFASVSQCRIYHADLHAGNVMVLSNGQIGFIDFGIVGTLSEQVWQALQALMMSLPAEDFQGTARALLNLGATKERIDVNALAVELEQLYRQFEYGDSATGADIDNSLDELLMQIGRIGKRYGIRFPRAFTLLIKQFLYFDRYIHALAPDLNVLYDERVVKF